MFDSLSDRFEGIFKRVRGRGRLSEKDIDDVGREIRRALLEADVNVRVAKAFVERVKAAAIGAHLSESLSPAQQFIKIVNDELVDTLGGESGKLTMSPRPPTVVLLAGLQGSGKTTHAGKLAKHLKRNGLQPLLVGADLQRLAAVEQLRTLAQAVDVPFFSEGSDPVDVARRSLEEAARLGRNVVIVDSAGRLQIDEALMDELRAISDAVHPHNTLLVVDAMTGQEAVNVAEAFHASVAIDGVILTKTDGDARGGAALSVKEVVGRPILFVGTGEKLDDFEPFHPDRMASRILGMGDMLSLIEKAEAAFDTDQAERAAEALQEGKLTLEDFLEQLQQVKKMGSLQNIVGMLPGMPKELKNTEIDDGELKRVEAIIQSMTPKERREPDLINGARRLRIANGAGVTTGDVNALLKQFKQMQQMMKQMGVTGRVVAKRGKKGKKEKRPKLRPGALGAGIPGLGVGFPGGPPGGGVPGGLPGGGIPGLGGATRGPKP